MTNQPDTNQASEDKLRELAERYAKDFGISYDKIRINPKGSVTYRQSGSNSGGWQESGSSVNLPYWVITGHYKQIEEVLDRLFDIANNKMYPNGIEDDIEAERNKLEESK